MDIEDPSVSWQHTEMTSAAIVDTLLSAEDPSIQWKVRVNVLGESRGSRAVGQLESAIRRSPRVQGLLRLLDGNGRLPDGKGVYTKWQGAHWVLASLADIGYPQGDVDLVPLADRVLETWLDPIWYHDFEAARKKDVHKKRGVPVMCGRHRRCASQQGNALFAISRLGLADDRLERLAERLLFWQWPDGGWNCDKNPSADSSSFMETLLPMSGLAEYARKTGEGKAAAAAHRAAEVFLERKLYRRRSDNRIMRTEFQSLHYPLYWHYDILGGLKAMHRVGHLDDPRCGEALDLLESKRLPDGGWPAEKRYYRASDAIESGNDAVDWGGASVRRMNPWVTADALAVLVAAGRTAVS